jgi:hypothetical protein
MFCAFTMLGAAPVVPVPVVPEVEVPDWPVVPEEPPMVVAPELVALDPVLPAVLEVPPVEAVLPLAGGAGEHPVAELPRAAATSSARNLKPSGPYGDDRTHHEQ